MLHIPVADRLDPPRVTGKFLAAGRDRLWIRGVTYGTFAPDATGRQFPPPERLADDFAYMRDVGINTLRTYLPPDTALLDLAAAHGLRVMVGLAWEQHVAFLDEARIRDRIRRDVVATVRRLASHPAVLLTALGNEIPAGVVRWLGPARVEAFLRELYGEAKSLAPDALFTYVNYPPTEYLDLSFADVLAFNVYLHRERELRAYLARLQNVAGSKPLLLAEAGADSIREGAAGQAQLTAMQIRAAFAEGACGAVAFAWTDEWWRGGDPVQDWAFGLVDAGRRPKPALGAVAEAFGEVPFPASARRTWPTVSVIVCAYNAAPTIDECLASLRQLTYPHVELIVVNDGSRDGTGDLARRHAGVRVLDVPNGGLSAARNIGLEAAAGEIVAYTDADVRVDPDWLTYLVQPFLTSDVVGAGGPNVVPPDDPWIAQCVARAPGRPTHVLLDDRVAEHVPGCNMAFRRDALLAIGGFNPIYLRAGDDVDVCWRLQARGGTIGFAPAALVWHRHRATVRGYWRQQVGYGEGEAWLVPHHPDKFVGRNIAWRGHVYDALPPPTRTGRARVHTGLWGGAPFPSVYRTRSHPAAFVPHMVRWQLGALALVAAGLLLWVAGGRTPGAALALAGAAGLTTTLVRCVRHALASDLDGLPAAVRHSRRARLACRGLIAWLHVIQPFARACGRVRGLLTLPRAAEPHAWRPVRAARPSGSDLTRSARLLARGIESRLWAGQWISNEAFLTRIAGGVRRSPLAAGLHIADGWEADRDISVAAGAFARIDLRVLVEEHAGGCCLVRLGYRASPRRLWTLLTVALSAWVATAASAPALLSGWVAAGASGALVLPFVARTLWQTAHAYATVRSIVADAAAELGMQPLPVPAAGPAGPAALVSSAVASAAPTDGGA